MASASIEPPTNGERASSGKAQASTDVFAVDVTPRAGARKAAIALKQPDRLFWRAVVRTGGMFAASRERDHVEWHLAGCAVPRAEGSHCNEGLHLLETRGQPDGHCLIDG